MKEIMKGTHAQQKRITNPQNSTHKSSQHSTLTHKTQHSNPLKTSQHSTLTLTLQRK